MKEKIIDLAQRFIDTTDVDALVSEPMNEKLEAGIDISSAVIGVILDAGSYSILKKLVKPVIDAEKRIPIKIIYKASTFAASAALSNGINSYISQIRDTAKTGIKAAKIMKKLADEENKDGDTAEQVC